VGLSSSPAIIPQALVDFPAKPDGPTSKGTELHGRGGLSRIDAAHRLDVVVVNAWIKTFNAKSRQHDEVHHFVWLGGAGGDPRL